MKGAKEGRKSVAGLVQTQPKLMCQKSCVRIYMLFP